MVLDRNTSPYYDDYNEQKNFYQILFRPGYAVQARELSQIQSTLQKQIQRFGQHVFKEGSMVIPGEIGIDTNYAFVKIEDQFNSLDVDVDNFLYRKITGTTSGAVATVLQVVDTTGSDEKTLYVKYDVGASSQSFTASITNTSDTVTGVSISATDRITVGALVSGTGIPANTYITEIVSASSFKMSNASTATNASAGLTVTTSVSFSDGETLETLDDDTILTNYSADVITSTNGATGFGSKVDIKSGVYFVFGFFCFVESQTLILDKYENTPSYRIGLLAQDSFVTEEDDVSLVDPASGSPNFNAPGAHRYNIELTLSKLALDAEIPDNFVELIRVKDGVIQKLVDRPEYSELEKTLARRTYDESGDYTVRAFPLETKEHLNNGTNFGLYSASNGGDETKFAYVLDAGKAYVRGFEVETRSSTILEANKPRGTLSKTNFQLAPTTGSYVFVEGVTGTFDISTMEEVDLVDADTNGVPIGSARVKSLEFVSGTPGTPSAKYKLYLFNILMDTDSNGMIPFSTVRSVIGAASTADCVLETGNAVLYDMFNNISIFAFPASAIKEFSDVSYTTKRYFSGVMSGNSITLTAGTDEIFSAGTVSNYHLSLVSASGTATGNGYATGDVVDLISNATIVLGGSPVGKQVTITCADIASSTVAVITNITKSNATQKTKTLTSRSQNGVAHSNTVQLDRADIFRIVTITDATTAADITDRYFLDNGQRDNYYARGRLLFNDTYPAPVGNIDIDYEYFEHGTGDYFSVNSYDGVIDYKDIQTYSASDGAFYDLINCFDFRPRENNAGNGFSVTSEFVVNGTSILCDFEYYVGRYDRLVLDSSGNFSVVTGAADIIPMLPPVPENSMLLYDVYLPPYVFAMTDINAKKIENKRYTMRDIGKLENRISNLEYYTQLSLLEKDTANLFIDDGTGLNRFKNGFVVDNFGSHLVGDVLNPDYKCSIDAQAANLRPTFSIENVGLLLSSGDSSNYTQTGDLITLPYTTEVLISQPFASKTENVNPYNVFNWVGNIDLAPSSDDWYETTNLPDYIITNNDEYNNALAAANSSFIWNDWETTWVGQEISRTVVQTGNSFASWLDPNRNLARTNLSRLTAAYGSEIGSNLTNIGNELNANGQNVNTGYLTEEIVREVEQSRAGTGNVLINTGVREEVIDDKVLSSSSIPFMREREIYFTAKNLKPNTRVYPYFDGVLVSQYCRPDDSNSINGDPLVSDINGTVTGLFELPNNDVLKFRTGTRDFTLMDNETLNSVTATTSSTASYTANGLIQTKQQTIVSTQLFEIVQSTVSETRLATVTATEKRRLTVPHIDPLAQTFFIQNADGVFLSDIDIYFASKDSNGIPINVQIRNVVNGTPGNQIVPFSTTQKLPSDITTSEDSLTATKFTFESPVYLQGNTEYCFVLLSNSNEYNVWCSKIGEFDVDSGARISQQPYAGVLFKSANNSTWTPDQEEDIKFNINRCVFDDSVTGSVLFRNTPVPLNLLPKDPFTTTSANTTISVNHPNHGMTTGKTVTFSGVSGAQNGIPAVELNTSFLVTVVDLDTYTIEFDSNNTLPTSTGRCGGDAVYATRNLRLDLANIMATTLEFPATSLNWGIKTRNLSETLASSFSAVAARENIQFAAPQLIVNPNDEAISKSTHVRSQMATTSDYLSPVVDTSRLSILVVSNRINDDFTGEDGVSGGNSVARYITKKISLSSSANSVRVSFAAIRPVEATIKVYVKYQLDEDQSSNFNSDISYVEMTQVDYPNGSTAYKDYTFELEDVGNFSVFAVKIVMLSSETTDVPIIKDFRAIALS